MPTGGRKDTLVTLIGAGFWAASAILVAGYTWQSYVATYSQFPDDGITSNNVGNDVGNAIASGLTGGASGSNPITKRIGQGIGDLLNGNILGALWGNKGDVLSPAWVLHGIESVLGGGSGGAKTSGRAGALNR